MKKIKPIRELYFAIKTRRLAPDFTLFDYWIWRMYRNFLEKYPAYNQSKKLINP
jgi:hypothetical protein